LCYENKITCQKKTFSHSIFDFLTLIRNVAVEILMPRGKKKGLSTKKFDRCVSKVKSKSGKKVNPYAVCNASMGGKSKHKSK